jgi:hypothetical protein
VFVEAVLYRYRAGIPWRDLPERFGDPIKLHTRFSRRAESGVWKKVLEILAAADKAFDADQRVIEPLRAAGKNSLSLPRVIERSSAPLTERCTRRVT